MGPHGIDAAIYVKALAPIGHRSRLKAVKMRIRMNASPRVFWVGLVLSVLAAVGIWAATGTGWGAAIVMGYVRVMFAVPHHFRPAAAAGSTKAAAMAPGAQAKGQTP